MYIKEKEVIERAHKLEIEKKEEAQQRYSEAVDKIEKKLGVGNLYDTRTKTKWH